MTLSDFPHTTQHSKEERVRRRIRSALIDLCEEKGYYAVKVNDICTYTELSRSTFYRYYVNKDDLLRDVEKQYVDDTRNITKKFRSLDRTAVENHSLLLQELTEDMRYHQKHRNLCLFLLSPAGDPYFARYMKEGLADSMTYSWRLAGLSMGKYHKYAISLASNGFVNIIYEWLKNQDCTAEEIAYFLYVTLQEMPSAINHGLKHDGKYQ